MSVTYVVRFNSQQADLMDTNGRFIRRYSRPGKTIVAASVCNAGDDTTVTVNFSDGTADLYDWTGRIIRRF